MRILCPNWLHVTAAGVQVGEAAGRIRSMAGPHRVPTLLKKVDRLARGRVKLRMNHQADLGE
jgi:hypothetical protein